MRRLLLRLRFTAFPAAIALIWAACTDSPDVAGPPQLSQAAQFGLDRAIEAQTRHTDRLMQDGDVVMTAVGLENGDAPVIMVYLNRGTARNVPRDLDGFRVQVHVTGPISALVQQGQDPKPRPKCDNPPCNGGGGGGGGGGDPVDPTARFDRPVPIGVSTGHPSITAGTIGARVKRGGSVFALSNNHVYAASNDASVGDKVIQPGAFDGGSSPADDIGTLADWVPINFSGGNNVVDAAIASTTTGLLGNSTPSDGYGTPSSSIATAVPGMRVQKYGRTTGQTNARVESINATVNVNYGAPGVARFVGQVVIRGGGFSSGGDSGSLIVVRGGSDNRAPVALLFAGGGGVTIGNPIDAVLSAFNVTIDGN